MSVSGDSIEKLMKTNQLKLEDGEINLFDFRMGMLPVRTITGFLESIYERFGNEAFGIMYEAGLKHGQMAIDEIGKEHDIPKKQFLQETLYTADTMGLGKFNLEKSDFEERIIVFRVDNSPFKEEFENSETFSDLETPIDHLHRGMFHRVAEVLLDSESVKTEETSCSFLGDECCRFVSREE